jgi:hypothetical protein
VQRLLEAQRAAAVAAEEEDAAAEHAAGQEPDGIALAHPGPVVQREVTTVAPAATDAPAAAAPAAGSASTTPGSSAGVTDVDALVGRLYDPLVRRLKAELRLDRERAGHVLDLRR